jgi:hypothetical protein
MATIVKDETTLTPLGSPVIDLVAPPKPSGPAAAALVSAGIGSLVLGLLTTLAEASPAVKTFLNFYNPVGPLAGKTICAVVAYLLSWAILAVVYRGKNPPLGPAFKATFVLVGLGLLGTFPVFYEAFTAH